MASQGYWRLHLHTGRYWLAVCHTLLGVLEIVHEQPVDEPKVDASLSRAEATSILSPTYVLLCGVFPVFVFGLWMLYAWLPNLCMKNSSSA